LSRGSSSSPLAARSRREPAERPGSTSFSPHVKRRKKKELLSYYYTFYTRIRGGEGEKEPSSSKPATTTSLSSLHSIGNAALVGREKNPK